MSPPVLLSYAFRPFFLLSSGWAVVTLAGWLALLHGLSWAGAPGNWVLWHTHETLIGFVGATVAGFLLTAIPTWTGRPPVQGLLLGLLVVAWTAGRVVSALTGTLPVGIVAPLELAFPVSLALVVTRELVAARNRRNYIVALLVSLFPLLDIAYLLAEYRMAAQSLTRALYLTPHLVILLITVIGGRIVPAFTTNWLRARGAERLPRVRPWVDRTALITTLAVGVADTVAPGSALTGILALATACVHGLRLSGWCGPATRSEPLLAILHVGYAWIVLGYGLLGATSFIEALPRSSALHAITAGAIGTMILAVMSRVALGHTGRQLHASLLIVVAYAMVIAAALFRIAAPMTGGAFLVLLDISAIAWMAAFAGFFYEYWPILTRPRVD